MYLRYTHSPKINFKSQDIINKSIKRKLQDFKNDDYDLQFVNSGNGVSTSQFNPDMEFSRNMSKSDLEVRPAYEYSTNFKQTRFSPDTRKMSKDEKFYNHSPAGTKHLRMRKEGHYVYDTNIYIDNNDIENLKSLPPHERERHLSAMKKYVLGVERSEGISHSNLKETQDMFDQIDSGDDYFHDDKEYVERTQEFNPESTTRSKWSTPGSKMKRRKKKSTKKKRSKSRSKSRKRSKSRSKSRKIKKRAKSKRSKSRKLKSRTSKKKSTTKKKSTKSPMKRRTAKSPTKSRTTRIKPKKSSAKSKKGRVSGVGGGMSRIK